MKSHSGAMILTVQGQCGKETTADKEQGKNLYLQYPTVLRSYKTGFKLSMFIPKAQCTTSQLTRPCSERALKLALFLNDLIFQCNVSESGALQLSRAKPSKLRVRERVRQAQQLKSQSLFENDKINVAAFILFFFAKKKERQVDGLLILKILWIPFYLRTMLCWIRPSTHANLHSESHSGLLTVLRKLTSLDWRAFFSSFSLDMGLFRPWAPWQSLTQCLGTESLL